MGLESMSWLALAVQLSELEDTATALAAMPEIDYVVITTGAWHVMAEVACRGTEELFDCQARSRPARGPAHRDLSVFQAPAPAVPVDERRRRARTVRGARRPQRAGRARRDGPGADRTAAERRARPRHRAATGVSERAISTRFARLVDEDLVRVIAVGNPHALGFRGLAWLGISVTDAADVEEVARAFAPIPQVSYLVSVSGRFDLMGELVCRDRDHLAATLNNSRRGDRGDRDRRGLLLSAPAVPQRGGCVGCRPLEGRRRNRHGGGGPGPCIQPLTPCPRPRGARSPRSSVRRAPSSARRRIAACRCGSSAGSPSHPCRAAAPRVRARVQGHRPRHGARPRRRRGATARGSRIHRRARVQRAQRPRRLLYGDERTGRRIDVFVGEFSMCHRIPVAERLSPIRRRCPGGAPADETPDRRAQRARRHRRGRPAAPPRRRRPRCRRVNAGRVAGAVRRRLGAVADADRRTSTAATRPSTDRAERG